MPTPDPTLMPATDEQLELRLQLQNHIDALTLALAERIERRTLDDLMLRCEFVAEQAQTWARCYLDREHGGPHTVVDAGPIPTFRRR